MILITGGIRSGKTAAAERLCKTFGQRVLYLAVTIPLDPESREKIKRSRGHRPYYWDTYETNFKVTDVVLEKGNDYDVILIDSMNNLVFNLIASHSEGVLPGSIDYRSLEMKILGDIRSLLDVALQQKARFIFVSTEMGMGMPITSPSSRFYCEIAGRVNQVMAESCADVYMMVCGLEVKIK